MPVASAVITVVDKYADLKLLHVFGTIAVDAAADTYQTGGLVLNFSPISRHVPLSVKIQGVKCVSYEWVKGTTPANQKLLIGNVGADTAEETEVAIDAEISGDTIQFHAIFKKV